MQMFLLNILLLIWTINAEINPTTALLDELINALEDVEIHSRIGLDSDILPEAVMTTMEIIRYHEYDGQRHQVITPDGYILEIHRINNGKANFTNGKRPPVILQHGIISCSATWLINGRADSLGFILADEGYDVWMPNLRGNTYSRRHVSISPHDDDFWTFSIDDHALVDMPAIVDYVLDKTSAKQLNYIGHSMGSTVGALFLSGKPEYNTKVKLAVLQAPVVFGRYVKNPLRLIAVHIREASSWYSLLGTKELAGSTEFLRALLQGLCSDYPSLILCEAVISMLGGYNEELIDRKRLHVIMSHLPAGTSWDVIVHFSQIFAAKKPVRFDFGSAGNMAHYGQATPLAYNLTQITSPLAMFYGYMDVFNDKRDVEALASQVANAHVVEMVPHDLWTHQDFQFAKNARLHHYNRLLEILKSFN